MASGDLSPVDPFLSEHLQRFGELVGKLEGVHGVSDVETAAELCRLSRRILFRLWPLEAAPRDSLERVVDLFTVAAERIGQGDDQTKGFPVNIRDRAQTIVDALRRQ